MNILPTDIEEVTRTIMGRLADERAANSLSLYDLYRIGERMAPPPPTCPEDVFSDVREIYLHSLDVEEEILPREKATWQSQVTADERMMFHRRGCGRCGGLAMILRHLKEGAGSDQMIRRDLPRRRYRSAVEGMRLSAKRFLLAGFSELSGVKVATAEPVLQGQCTMINNKIRQDRHCSLALLLSFTEFRPNLLRSKSLVHKCCD